MGEDAVDLFAERWSRRPPRDHALHKRIDPGIAGDRLAGWRRVGAIDSCEVRGEVGPGRGCCIGGSEDRVAKLIDALAGRCHDGHHGAAEPRGKLLDVDRDALAFGKVGERERDDRGQAHLDHLTGEIEVADEVCGIGHHDHDRGLRHTLHPTVEHVDGHLFVGALGRKAVGARQVDQFDRAVAVAKPPHLFLDGHAGIVADPRGDAGQRREEGALAGVRVANKGDGEGCGGGRRGGGGGGVWHDASQAETAIRAASVRRIERW